MPKEGDSTDSLIPSDRTDWPRPLVPAWPIRRVLVLSLGIVLTSLFVANAHASPTPVSVECTPLPVSCEGWYRGPVTVRWSAPSATDVAPGTCVPVRTFQTDTTGTKSTCIAWTGSPDTGVTEANVVIKIDSTAPTVLSMSPDRSPDSGSWFNHPVTFSFRGADATSGVASCSSTTYAGPDGLGASVGGTCRDVAGNVGSGSFSLNYDTTPPPAPAVQAMPGNKSIALSWSTSPDSQAEVARLDGNGAPVVVYRGPGGAFTDRSLKNGQRYRYAVSLIDQAGNRAVGTTSTVPTSSNLLVPPKGSHIRAVPVPLLIWKPVRKADYYNVQIFRGRTKVLSSWPREPRFQLKRRWRFGGKRYRLVPAKYCWYVWPGYGKRAKRDYGKRLGRSCFRIVR
jgi:hypothetical protein